MIHTPCSIYTKTAIYLALFPVLPLVLDCANASWFVCLDCVFQSSHEHVPFFSTAHNMLFPSDSLVELKSSTLITEACLLPVIAPLSFGSLLLPPLMWAWWVSQNQSMRWATNLTRPLAALIIACCILGHGLGVSLALFHAFATSYLVIRNDFETVFIQLKCSGRLHRSISIGGSGAIVFVSAIFYYFE